MKRFVIVFYCFCFCFLVYWINRRILGRLMRLNKKIVLKVFIVGESCNVFVVFMVCRAAGEVGWLLVSDDGSCGLVVFVANWIWSVHIFIVFKILACLFHGFVCWVVSLGHSDQYLRLKLMANSFMIFGTDGCHWDLWNW